MGPITLIESKIYVIPAEAGIQSVIENQVKTLDSRFRAQLSGIRFLHGDKSVADPCFKG